MKKKLIVVVKGNVRIESIENDLVKISVADSYFGTPKWIFYVPQSSRDKYGFIPSEIVKSRLKHDFNVEIGHYSTTLA